MRPGDAAPGFKLAAHDGGQVELVALRGRARVLLAFYRDLQDPACVRALASLQAALPRFDALGVKVYGIGDGSAQDQAAQAARMRLGYLLLADPQHRVAKLYGATGPFFTFTRKAVVVDGRGVLRFMHDGPPHIENLLGFIEALRGDVAPPQKETHG